MLGKASFSVRFGREKLEEWEINKNLYTFFYIKKNISVEFLVHCRESSIVNLESSIFNSISSNFELNRI